MDWTLVFFLALFIPRETTAAGIGGLVLVQSARERVCIKKEKGDDTVIGFEFASDGDENLVTLQKSAKNWAMWPTGLSKSFLPDPSNGWVKMSNVDLPGESFGSIEDTRWYGFPDARTDDQSSGVIFNLTTTQHNTFEEHFSILARNPGLKMKLETEDHMYYQVQFGNRNAENSSKSGFEIQTSCNFKNNYACDSTQNIASQKSSIISGLKWSLLSLKMDGLMRIYTHSDEEELSWGSNKNITFKTISFKQDTSNAYAIIKRHYYEMLVAPNYAATLKKEIVMDRTQRLCLSVPYFSPGRSMQLKIITDHAISKTLQATGQKWKVQRIMSDGIIKEGTKYELQITGKSEAGSMQAVGKIRHCTENEYSKIATASVSVKNCFEVGTSQKISLTSRRIVTPDSDETTESEFWNAVSGGAISDQSKMIFHQADGQFCWKGFQATSCETSCPEGAYGFNCNKKCSNCIGQKCNKINGACGNTTHCLNNYHPPFCTLLHVTKGAEVVEGSETTSSAQVDITKAVNTLPIGKTHLIQYLSLETEYVGILANKLKLHAPKINLSWPLKNKIVGISGFRSASKYYLKVLVHEKNTSDFKKDVVTTEIKTKACTHTNSIKDIGAVTKDTAELRWKNKKELSGSCPPQDYTVEVNGDQAYGTYSVNGLEPFSPNVIKLGAVKFSFNTSQAAPSEVMNLRRVGSLPSFEWEEPGKMNGIFQHYLVTLKHIKFKACENGERSPSLDMNVKVLTTSVEFSNLEPYSEYSLSVAAVTVEMGKAETISVQPLTYPSESIKAAPILTTKTKKTQLNLSWEPNCRKTGCQVQWYKLQITNENKTIADIITTKMQFTQGNLTKGTSYKVNIEARCSHENNWAEGGPGFLRIEVSTDHFDGYEIAGIVVGVLVSLLCIAALIALIIWRVRLALRRKGGEMPCKGGKLSDSEMTVRYVMTPKKIGTTYKRKTIEEQVRRCQENGTFKMEFEALPKGKQKDWHVGMTATNVVKNRYANIAAYDHTRVVLEGPDDYINANFIEDRNCSEAYIATQGPLPSTSADLWRMVWQKEVTTIVMLTKLQEQREQCHQYWPNLDSSETYGEILVQNRSEENFSDHIARTLILTGRQGVREILQLQYTAWPHQGVPNDLPALALFIAKVHARKTPPLLVHCSGGTGRTGTVILTDLCLRALVKDKKVNVWNVLHRMRQQRVNMVETEQQYELVHFILAQRPQNIIL